MLDNSAAEPVISNNTEIITQIYKNNIFSPELIKEEDNTTNMLESHNLSSNLLNPERKLTQIEKLKNGKKGKNRSSLNKNNNNQSIKKMKKVKIDNPFISVVLVESYKDSNLKMTYNEYETNTNVTGINNKSCCKMKLCLLF